MHCLVGDERRPAVSKGRGGDAGRSQAETSLTWTGAQGRLAQELTLELRPLDKKGDWGAERTTQRKNAKMHKMARWEKWTRRPWEQRVSPCVWSWGGGGLEG